MKICLLGEYSGELDEGMRKVSSYFAEALKEKNQVLTLDLRNIFTKDLWKDVKRFNPEIIHYIHGSSIKSFILLKLISLYCRDAKTVISAMHPSFSILFKRFISLFKPDMMGEVNISEIKMERRINAKEGKPKVCVISFSMSYGF